jgi:hypothetical protein
MEFPDEILAHIRGYAKPRFKYFREYKRILQLMKADSWPMLRECLMRRPEGVLPFLLDYTAALSEWIELDEKDKMTLGSFVYGDPEYKRLYYAKLDRRRVTHLAFIASLGY